MTVRIRAGHYTIDFRVTDPETGKVERYRIACPPDKQSQRKAEAFERACKADIARGIDPRRTYGSAARGTTATELAPTIEGYAETYLAERRAQGQARSTVANKQALFSQWIFPTVGKVRVTEIRTSHFATLREIMSAGKLSPGRINLALNLLSNVVRWYHERRDLPVPAFTVGRVKGEGGGKAVKRWTDEEINPLLAAAKLESSEAYVAILLGLDAGMRLSEVRALQWSDLDLGKRPAVTIERSRDIDTEGPTKGGKARHVPLTPRLVAALKAHPRGLHDPHVIVMADGQPWTRPKLAKLARRVVRSAGIPDGGFHTLRHTFCSRLAERGVDVNTIKALAGHASISVTQKYMHLAPGGLDRAIRALTDNLAAE